MSSHVQFDSTDLEHKDDAMHYVNYSVVTNISLVSAYNPIALQSSAVIPLIIDYPALSNAYSMVFDDDVISISE